MIYEIENIRKLNILERFLGIDSHKVTIRDELGKRYNINCWAGLYDADITHLLFELNKNVCKIEERSKPKPKGPIFEERVKSALVGKKFITAEYQLKWVE